MSATDLKEVLQLHFVLCIERSGSSLLASILNSHSNIITPIEEPFLVYNYEKYKNVTKWEERVVSNFVNDLFRFSTENAKYLYPARNVLIDELINECEGRNLSYLNFCKLVYTKSIPNKDIDSLKFIIDKQIRLTYSWKQILKISPASKFIVLMRNPVDNVVSRINRKMGFSLTPAYLAKTYQLHYKQAFELRSKHPEKVLMLTYEDLVSNVAHTISEICQFIGADFDPSMLDYQDEVKRLFDTKEVDHPTLMKRVRDIQSKLIKPVSKKNIDIGSTLLTAKEEQVIYKITSSVFNSSSDYKEVKFNITDRIEIIKAVLINQIILKVYLRLPLSGKKILNSLNKFLRKRNKTTS